MISVKVEQTLPVMDVKRHLWKSLWLFLKTKAKRCNFSQFSPRSDKLKKYM